MKNLTHISCLAIAAVALTGCGSPTQDAQPAETVTITATPSAKLIEKTPENTPKNQQTASSDPKKDSTPANLMAASSTNENITYEDQPHALVITLPMTHENDEVYSYVNSEMNRALRLLNGTEVGSHLRSIAVYSSDGMMLEQTKMPVDPADIPDAQPSPTGGVPNDHAPRGDDLIITPPPVTPVPNLPGVSVDMSLVGQEGIRDGNYEIYLNASKGQIDDGPAARIIAEARADSLKGSAISNSIKNVKVYSSDLSLLESAPVAK